MRDDGERLRDMLEAIDAIERYAARGRKAFDEDELIQTWMVHHIQVIGEAAGQLSADLQQRHQDVPWARIVSMRNILVHDYAGVDLATVWGVVENRLPELKRQVGEIRDELDSDKPDPAPG